jgi:hypothetical protein
MRHTRALAVAVPASVLLILGLFLASTGASAAGSPTFIAKATKTGLQNATGGVHPGSAWFAQGDLLADNTHADMGTGYIRCDLNVNKFWQCNASLFFTHKGEIISEGAFRLDRHTGPFTFAITGGTGMFSKAHGTISIDILNDMRARFTLNVT